jgi:hypothetical protein
MKFYLLDGCCDAPLADLFGGPLQIFQNNAPDLSRFFVDRFNSSDVLFVPNDAMHLCEDYRNFISSLASKNRIFVLNRGDRPVFFKERNIYSLQNSITFRKSQNVILLPYNILPVESKKVNILHREPIASFVGYVPKSILSRFVNNLPHSIVQPLSSNGPLIRKLMVSDLRNSNLRTILITRSHYGGAESLLDRPEIFREEFVDSIQSSQYVFCPRGDANASQRLFETLSAGRIPVVPNSKAKLPYIFDSSHPLTLLEYKPLFESGSKVVLRHWETIDKRGLETIFENNRMFFQRNWEYGKFFNNLLGLETIEALHKTRS